MAEPVTIDAVVDSELASISMATIRPRERVDAETVFAERTRRCAA